MSGIRWGYALNQWDTNIDDFVRRRAHERAFKTVSISGFSAVELTAESFGPWEPLGTPKQIANLYGSLDEFRDALRSCALEGVSSYVYDPFVGFDVEMGRGHDPLAPGSATRIAETAVWFSEALWSTCLWVPKGFDVYPRGLGPGAPPPARVETETEGAGYVPMFRAVSEAVQSGWTEHPAHPLSATIGTLELVDEVRRRLLDTYYPARGALEPWDSIAELPVDVRN